MMYDQTSIQLLVDRIGWSNPIQPNTEITLSDENQESASGRYFDSFHALAIVENVYKCVTNKDILGAEFNAFLYKMKKDTVMEVLSKIFDTNPLAYSKTIEDRISLNWKEDYTLDIVGKVALFDDVIGYAMAVRALQLFVSSTRSNGVERKVGISYELLKTELEGVVNHEGVMIAKGARGEYQAAIVNTIAILFPSEKRLKPRLYGRNSW